MPYRKFKPYIGASLILLIKNGWISIILSNDYTHRRGTDTSLQSLITIFLWTIYRDKIFTILEQSFIYFVRWLYYQNQWGRQGYWCQKWGLRTPLHAARQASTGCDPRGRLLCKQQGEVTIWTSPEMGSTVCARRGGFQSYIYGPRAFLPSASVGRCGVLVNRNLTLPQHSSPKDGGGFYTRFPRIKKKSADTYSDKGG